MSRIRAGVETEGREAMSERARTLAARLEQVSGEVVTFIRQCPDENWRSITKAEQWPVCSVCRHIARGFEVHPQVIGLAANGEPMPTGYTWDDIHHSNVEQARDWAQISKEETLAPLRRYADEAVAFVHLLSDKQLDHTTKAPLDDTSMSVQQMVEGVIDHARVHLESVRATTTVH